MTTTQKTASNSADKLTAKMDALDAAYSELFGVLMSVTTMLEVSQKDADNGTFPEFFRRIYSAHAEGKDGQTQRGLQQNAMMYTYFEDLCENLTPDLNQEMQKKLEDKSMTMSDLHDICGIVIENLKEKQSELAKEMDEVAYSIALQPLKNAA